MKDRNLASRYARALMSALPDPTSRRRADACLEALAASVSDSAELRAVLLDPAVAAGAKAGIVKALAQREGADATFVRFVATVAQNGRLAQLPAIAQVFQEECLLAEGIVTATLTAAAPLPPDLEARATAALEKLSGRKVRLDVEIDPGLLGGATARIGSMVYDGSIKTQLARLRSRLGEE